MGTKARLGVLCLMVMAVGLARLVEVEFRPAPVQLALTGPEAPGAEVAPPQPAAQAAPATPVAPQSIPVQAATPQSPAAPSATPTPEPAGQTYTVQSGDTLGTISLKVYGTSHAWERIYEANRDRIPNPRKMRQGIVLRIPPK
jgi:nucleoid-associated protein YgaU